MWAGGGESPGARAVLWIAGGPRRLCSPVHLEVLRHLFRLSSKDDPDPEKKKNHEDEYYLLMC